MNPHLQDLITQSVELMFIGMGAVFSILVLLITLITLISRLVQRYAAEEAAHPPPARAQRSQGDAGSSEAETIAVIGAAIRAWRQRQP
jgi:oxaloacetate decarboxylase gamma subunit